MKSPKKSSCWTYNKKEIRSSMNPSLFLEQNSLSPANHPHKFGLTKAILHVMNEPEVHHHLSPADLSPQATYKLMTGIVVPRPIAWITTVSREGVVNLAPFSCYTIVSTKPAMIGVNIGRKAGLRKDTAVNIADSQAFVVNIADQALLEPLHLSADEHPPDVSEVELLGLATQPSENIAPPRLAAAPVSLECRLHTVIPFGDTGAEFFVGEIVRLHIRENLLKLGKIDSAELDPICRLAGPNYATLGQVITMQPVKQTDKAILQGEAPRK